MATKLCTPIIGDLLSNLSQKIFVSNCVPGATVFIHSLTRPGDVLVQAQIGAPDGFLDLWPGAGLLGGDRLVASETDAAGNVSPETHPDLAVTVGHAPTSVADITPVDISGWLWQCGRHAYVGGAIPGAAVEVLRSGVVIGSAVAQDGTARLSFPSLNPDERLEVRQSVGPVPGPSLLRDVRRLPGNAGDDLPAPVIMGPVRACQSAIRIEGVYEGTEVTVTRTSGEVETAPFDLSGLWFRLGTPLTEANGAVKAKQAMPACRRDGLDATTDIGPPVPPPPPFVYPLCAGMTSVFIDNLERGAEVRITVGADVYVTFASAAGHNRFDVEPLPAGPITVQSFLCQLGSDVVTATVATPPATIDQPELRGPLVKCQRSVTVDLLKPGATVQVWAKGPSDPDRPISGKRVVIAPTMEIDVTTLPEGADVWAVQWACALVRRESDPPIHVGQSPTVTDPDFTGLVTRTDTIVAIKGTIRDAIVEVLRRTTGEEWELIGFATAKGSHTAVPLQATLAVGQELQVRQRYCAVQSPGRTRTTVVKPVPLQPVILMPAPGQPVPVGMAVGLAWKDPASGADADRKADTFDVVVQRDGVPVLNVSIPGTTAALTQATTALYSSNFSWSVTPRNSTGAGTAAHSTFKTPKAPDPIVTAVQDQAKIKVTGTGFAPSHVVDIDIAIEYQAQVGSPQGPVMRNDNRTGKATTTSTATGTIDSSFSAAEALEPRNELTGPPGATGSQQVKAPPYPNAQVRVKAHNKPPIKQSEGSLAWSNTVIFSWS